MRAVSDFDTVADGVRIEAPGYAVFDALLGYRISDAVEAQLFVSNLADREYVNRINNLSRGTFFGEPRGAEFRLSFRF
jgi:outer membrane receptor for monomeric catechols